MSIFILCFSELIAAEITTELEAYQLETWEL
jgi:hypothetical protein